jgi:DNA-binding transcriptional ArsR family regulator
LPRSASSHPDFPEKQIDSSELSDIFNYERSQHVTDIKKWTDLEALGRAAECLRVLAHPHRLRMIQMLLAGDFTVTQLAESCELPTAMASEHLRLMQRCGFLTAERDGRKVFYRVAEPHLKNIMQCIEDRFDRAVA